MNNKCPRCGGEIKCLAGHNAHPLNWYCVNGVEYGCGWAAWATMPLMTKPEESAKGTTDGLIAELEAENQRAFKYMLELSETVNKQTVEIVRLRKQCEGLARAAMNNGQELLLFEGENDNLKVEIKTLAAKEVLANGEVDLRGQTIVVQADEITRLLSEIGRLKAELERTAATNIMIK